MLRFPSPLKSEYKYTLLFFPLCENSRLPFDLSPTLCSWKDSSALVLKCGILLGCPSQNFSPFSCLTKTALTEVTVDLLKREWSLWFAALDVVLWILLLGTLLGDSRAPLSSVTSHSVPLVRIPFPLCDLYISECPESGIGISVLLVVEDKNLFLDSCSLTPESSQQILSARP